MDYYVIPGGQQAAASERVPSLSSFERPEVAAPALGSFFTDIRAARLAAARGIYEPLPVFAVLKREGEGY